MPRQHPPDFRRRALRLFETTMEGSEVWVFDAIRSVATKLGISEELVRRWRRKAVVDAGDLPATSSSEHAEIGRLTRKSSSYEEPMRF
jgi:transposase